MTYKTRTASTTPLQRQRPAPTTPLKRKELAPRVAAKLVMNVQQSSDIPCFIDIVESVELSPGKRVTYDFSF